MAAGKGKGKAKGKACKGKRKVRMTWTKRPKEVNSLATLQRLIDRHHETRELRVRVEALGGLSEATSVQNLLRHQQEERGWFVTGMRHIDALVDVERMLGASAALLDKAIAHMEVAAAAAPGHSRHLDDPDLIIRTPSTEDGHDADPVFLAPVSRRLSSTDLVVHAIRVPGVSSTAVSDGDQPIVRAPGASGLSSTVVADGGQPIVCAPTPAARGFAIELVPASPIVASGDTEDSASAARRLSERMLEAGTGQLGEPSPVLLDLALRVLDVESTRDIVTDVTDVFEPRSTYRVCNARVAELAERMLEAGTGRRGRALLPAPGVVELAARVVAGESPRRDYAPETQGLFTGLLDSGTALKHHLVATSSTLQSAITVLGEQMEEVAGDVLTTRHAPAILLGELRDLKAQVTTLLESSLCFSRGIHW